ncbi:MAG: ABC transporter substrate-binding protein [Bacilli bacterium]|nr:ABC transporter substrate-binding protein [Bacilli bacterium]MDD4076636.1 ABC transporter substrate-binding protein [Bacilli bacterium]MDD4388115.1 ABC transporter substrate-binding protein [Bacilli bacterium]
MKLKKLFILLLIFIGGASLIGCEDSNLIQIGILQYLEHNALSEARRGFIDGLAEADFVDGKNIKIKVYNPETDAPTMALQAKKLVRSSDLILAIATPAASAVVNEAKERGKNIPILFTAVTDPVDAKLIESNEHPGGNVTGTNDMNPIPEQISLVKELVPNATKLGIIYTGSEPNSEVQAGIAKIEAEKIGLQVTVKTIESINDLQQVANQLAAAVDVLYIPTDNAIAGAMGIINEIVRQKKIPAIVGEPNNVDAGGSITYGVDYYNLGKETALMAIKILRDKVSPKDIPSTGLSEYSLVINKKQLDLIGVAVPQELLDKADKIIE